MFQRKLWLAIKRAVNSGRLVRTGRMYRVKCSGGGVSPGETSATSAPLHLPQLRADPIPICSICMGTKESNRVRLPEELLSCVDCGSSGHPSCLKFSPELITNIKAPHWQCHECKICSCCCIQGKNVDKMLFCQSCDQGFHMECCDPPLAHMPKGRWICPVCQPKRGGRRLLHQRAAQIKRWYGRPRGRPQAWWGLLAAPVGERSPVALTEQKSPGRGLKVTVSPTPSSSSARPVGDFKTRLSAPTSLTRSRKAKGLIGDQSQVLTSSPISHHSWDKVPDSSKPCGHEGADPPVLQTPPSPEEGGSPLSSSSQSSGLSLDNAPCRSQLKGLFDGLSHIYVTQRPARRKHQPSHAPPRCAWSRLCPLPGPLRNALPPPSSGWGLSRRQPFKVAADFRNMAWLKRCRTLGRLHRMGPQRGAPADGPVTPKQDCGSEVQCATRPQSWSLGVTTEDVEMFRHVQELSSLVLQKTGGQSGPHPGHRPLYIELGNYEIQTWFSSPYPPEYSRLHKLYICEFCLAYMKSRVVLQRHTEKHACFRPPADEIYRKDELSVFEVDGSISKIFCQNLCLLAKFFLQHKTLYYDVEPFLFYVLTRNDSKGCHLVGYFSKEKHSQQNHNVSCIMVLPQYQRQGYGHFLIDFSYLLSRCEGQTGSPEKPLSSLGRLSYLAYWRGTILEHLERQRGAALSIRGLSRDTGICPHDIATTLQELHMVEVRAGRCVLVWREQLIREQMERRGRKSPQHTLHPECLHWPKGHCTALAVQMKQSTSWEEEEQDIVRLIGASWPSHALAQRRGRLCGFPRGEQHTGERDVPMPVPKRKRGRRQKQVNSSVTTETISERTAVLHDEGSPTRTRRTEGELPQAAKRKRGWPKGVKRSLFRRLKSERKTGFKLNLYTPPETPVPTEQLTIPEEPEEGGGEPMAGVEPTAEPPSPVKPDTSISPFCPCEPPLVDKGLTDWTRADSEEDTIHVDDHTADGEDDGHSAPKDSWMGGAATEASEGLLFCSEGVLSEVGGAECVPGVDRVFQVGVSACEYRPPFQTEEDSSGALLVLLRNACTPPDCHEADPTRAVAWSPMGKEEPSDQFQDYGEACRDLQDHLHLEQQSPPVATLSNSTHSEQSSPLCHLVYSVSSPAVSLLESSYAQISPEHGVTAMPHLRGLDASPVMDAPSMLSEPSGHVVDSSFSDLGSIESNPETYGSPGSYDCRAGAWQAGGSYSSLESSVCAMGQQVVEGLMPQGHMNSPQSCYALECPPTRGCQTAARHTVPGGFRMAHEVVGLGLYEHMSRAEYVSAPYGQPTTMFSLSKLQQLTSTLMEPVSFSWPASQLSYGSTLSPSACRPQNISPSGPPPDLTPPAMIQCNVAMPPPQKLQMVMIEGHIATCGKSTLPPAPQQWVHSHGAHHPPQANIMPGAAYSVNSLNVNMNMHMAPIDHTMTGYMPHSVINGGHHVHQPPQYSMQMGKQHVQAPVRGDVMYDPTDHRGYADGAVSRQSVRAAYMRR
ncbi:histone acetyltransferase KAT6B-like isoform X2 [Brienomyrus brachyistius]|uniref:histone acetyltransferase KAT6B-like isoform X2 n=1 Tax=Brienomyrus brachyistius TaxID=42636 RepID=UPI0020B19D53|nr:histone acetyltransferase KAT6B-like isoform X2 [Brienomyrus brachyistius]